MVGLFKTQFQDLYASVQQTMLGLDVKVRCVLKFFSHSSAIFGTKLPGGYRFPKLSQDATFIMKLFNYQHDFCCTFHTVFHQVWSNLKPVSLECFVTRIISGLFYVLKKLTFSMKRVIVCSS